MYMKSKAWKKRVWLNPSSSDDNGYVIYGQDEEGDPTLKIADCTRIVSLSLHCYTEKEKKQRIKKLKLIRDACQELIEAMEKIE